MRETKSSIRTAVAGFAVLGAMFGSAAQAGCLDAKAVAVPFAGHLAERSGGQFFSAVYHPGVDGAGTVAPPTTRVSNGMSVKASLSSVMPDEVLTLPPVSEMK